MAVDLCSRGRAAAFQQNPSSKKMDLIATSKNPRLGLERDDNPNPGKLSGKMCRIIWALKRCWETHDNKEPIPLQWWEPISDISRELNMINRISVSSVLRIKLSDLQPVWFFSTAFYHLINVFFFFFKQFKISFLNWNLKDADSPSQKQIPWLKIR